MVTVLGENHIPNAPLSIRVRKRYLCPVRLSPVGLELETLANEFSRSERRSSSEVEIILVTPKRK